MEQVKVALGDRSYEIVVGAGLLKRSAESIAPLLRAPRVIVITDTNVGPLYAHTLKGECEARGIRVEVVTLPAGEATKSFTAFTDLMHRLLELKPDRRTTLVALGGGVIGDITGFAASVLLRGVDFIQIPTTLLAQVDSSVGGKTGINTAQGKNLVGSFYQPKAVIIDTDTYRTLPMRERKAGYAEVIKYGLIADAAFYQWLLRHGQDILAGDEEKLRRAIIASCTMKANIVGEDERESGARAHLNFGHTFGHALEAETGFSDTLLHGEAVAIGMVMGCMLSQKMGLIDANVATELTEHLRALDIPASPRDIRTQWDSTALMQHMSADKKAEDAKLTFIVLASLGVAKQIKDVSPALAQAVLQEALAA